MTLANRKAMLLGGILLLALTAAAVIIQAVWRPLSPRVHIDARVADIDLSRPDALIRSEKLSALPRDLLRVPLLRDVLSEDFVSYYEINESRLSLAGTLRRIAYEHKLDISDELVRRAFDEPAEVALWRGDHGRLRYWTMVSQRNGLSRLLQGVANVALKDSQLQKVGQLTVDGDDTALYALAYGYKRNLLFAAHGDRLVVLSDPGMLLDAEGALDGERGDLIGHLLEGRRGKAAWAVSTLASDSNGPRLEAIKGHQLTVSAPFLSFGYQPFFPGIEALRFDFSASNDEQWATRALINPALLPGQWNSAALWQALPADPAACVSLPVSWNSAAPVLGAVVGPEQTQRLLGAFAGPAAMCWYGKSRLSSPLLVARLSQPDVAAAMQPELVALFTQVIGAYEANAGTADGRLPVTTREGATGAGVWQREVSARYGSATADRAAAADQLSSNRYFPVTLSIARDYVLFSPDSNLVDDALAVQAKTWPAVVDTMGDDDAAHVIARITPATLASLIEQEAFASLPQSQEPVFRNAAAQYLLPKLRALGHYPTLSLRLPDALPNQRGWVPVQWQQAAPAKGGAGAASAAR